MKNYMMIFIIIIIGSFSVKGQSLDCPVYTYEGDFLYEISDDLRSLDDMIFRKNGLVFQFNNKPIYSQGLFQFEENKDELLVEEYGNCTNSSYYSTFLSDSLHHFLDTLKGLDVEINNLKYKKLSLRIKAIPIGMQKLYIYNENEKGESLMPNFLVKQIELLQRNE